MINEELTDRDRVELTKLSYEAPNVGETVVVAGKRIGQLTRDVYAKDGMQAFLIENNNEITVLFKGSYGFKKGNATTWRDEWLNTNWPIFLAMLTNQRQVPSALVTASRYLNRWLEEFPDGHFYIYGHSLGAINAEYALANCRFPDQIAGAYLYEGTNIWRLLTHKERQLVAQLRGRINTYVDIYDPVTLGYTASKRMVGKLHYVDSLPMNPVKQHMWGGYRFDGNGNLLEKEVDQRFMDSSKMQQAFLSRTGRMANYLRYHRNLQTDWQKESEQRAEQIREELFNHSFLQDFNEQDKNSKDSKGGS